MGDRGATPGGHSLDPARGDETAGADVAGALRTASICSPVSLVERSLLTMERGAHLGAFNLPLADISEVWWMPQRVEAHPVSDWPVTFASNRHRIPPHPAISALQVISNLIADDPALQTCRPDCTHKK